MNVMQAILKKLAISKTKKEIRKVKEKFKNDAPTLEKLTGDLEVAYDQLESELEVYCKMWPDSPLCRSPKKMKY